MSGWEQCGRFSHVVILYLIVIVGLSTPTFVTLTKYGYQNVVINIQENTGFANCQLAIDGVKQLVQNTSTSFAKGLYQPVYFENVVIIVPKSWANDPSCFPLLKANTNKLEWARSSRADMQITPHHPVFGSSPYSFQYGGCFVPGLSINVPSSFVSNNSILARGKKMAREWAHYRYGVFDEGGIPKDPRHPSGYMVFQTDRPGMVTRVNTCTDNKLPKGDWIGGDCTSTGDSNCEFVADIYNPGVKSSLMYRPDLDDMETFCTSSNHDDSVPSKLSYHCGSLSASDVIYKHPDFNPAVMQYIKDIKFNVIENPFSGYHVILDIASFSNGSLFNVAKTSLMQFINFLVDPVRLSIDIYNEKGWAEFQPPVELNFNIKHQILKNLTEIKWSSSASANTFYQALENAQKRANDGQDVIILTAIQDSVPQLSTWITNYEEDKITVHLVHFGVSTSEFVQIANLALYGSVQFIPNFAFNDDASSYTWTVNSLQSIYSQTRMYRAKISEQSVIKNSSLEDFKLNTSFYLDSSSSRLLISLYYLKVDDSPMIESFALFQPNGESIIIPDNNIYEAEEFYAVTIEPITKALLEPGLWRFEIVIRSASPNRAMRIDVFAEAQNATMIELRTWNSAFDNKAFDFTLAPIGLYAQLTLDRRPINGANVMALVYAGFSNGTSSLVAQITLKDEGIADVTSGDGIYSGWLSTFSNSSTSYSIYYWAYSVNSNAAVENGAYDRPPTTGSVIPMSDPVPAVKQFNRFVYGPSLQLTYVTIYGYDRMPPERVTDLTIASYDSSNRIAVLEWTASRDNFGTGDIILRYELERTVGSKRSTKITRTFNSAETKLSWTEQVPPVDEGEYVRYRIKGIDPSSNWADTSNVVSLAGPNPGNKLSTGAIVGIVMGFVLFSVILVILLVYFCCSRKRNLV